MRQGRIHRTATPQELPDDPQDARSATFLSLGTIWRPIGAATLSGEVRAPWGLVTLASSATSHPPGYSTDLCLLIRPEAVHLHRPDRASATISGVRGAGDRTVATFGVPGAPPLSGYVPPEVIPGQRYRITLDPQYVTLLH